MSRYTRRGTWQERKVWNAIRRGRLVCVGMTMGVTEGRLPQLTQHFVPAERPKRRRFDGPTWRQLAVRWLQIARNETGERRRSMFAVPSPGLRWTRRTYAEQIAWLLGEGTT